MPKTQLGSVELILSGEAKTRDYNVRIRDASSDATATRISAFPRLQVKHIRIRQTKEPPRSQLWKDTVPCVSDEGIS